MTTDAPDGGWGYVVAAAAFFVAFFLDGLENSFGVVLPHLVDEFDVGVPVVTFCGGLITGVCLGVGPIVAMLIKKFGCRPLAFGGGILAATSLALCTLARSIAVFTVFYGVCAGCGIGMLYLPSITTVNTYFERKRGVVVGVVTSGSGIGLFVMSLLIDRLIAFYGWRGCYLVLSGIYLHLCVCASLLRPVHSKINKLRQKLNYENEDKHVIGDCNHDSHTSKGDIENLYSEKEKGHCVIEDNECDGSYREISEKPLLIVEDTDKRNGSAVHKSLDMIPDNAQSLFLGEAEVRDRANTATQADYKPYIQIQQGDRSHSSHPQLYSSKSNGSITALHTAKLKHRAKSSELLKTVLYQDRRTKPPGHNPNLRTSLSVLNVPVEYVSMTSLCEDPTKADAHSYSPNANGSLTLSPDTQSGRSPLQVSTSGLSTSALPPTNPFSLLKIVRFDLFCGGAFLTQVALVVPAMLTPSYALSLGLDTSKAATIVSVLGIANTIGRFVAGLLAFMGLRSLLIYNTGIFLAGVTCFLISFCTTHPALIAFAACHGFFIGAFPPLQSVILVEQLGLHLLPASFGVLCLSKSFASVLGPTLAGALYSMFDDYVAPFYFTGGLLTVATILHGLMACWPKTRP